MEQKKIYENADIEVIDIVASDVITASEPGDQIDPDGWGDV